MIHSSSLPAGGNSVSYTWATMDSLGQLGCFGSKPNTNFSGLLLLFFFFSSLLSLVFLPTLFSV